MIAILDYIGFDGTIVLIALLIWNVIRNGQRLID